MRQALCIFIGSTLLFLSIHAQWGGVVLDHIQLSLADSQGGNPDKYAHTVRCDAKKGGFPRVYVGCTKVGGTCTQCVTANADGSLSGAKIKVLGDGAAANGVGEQYYNNTPATPPQSCGNLVNGTCAAETPANPSPSGFNCVGIPGVPCTLRPFVGPQPLPITGTP